MTNEELAQAAAQGDMDAMAALLEANRGWVYKVAGRYCGFARVNRGADLDDLQQAAALGMIEAARDYDASRGAWLTWATYYMRREIRGALGLLGRDRAEYHTRSLDAPLTEDGQTLADLLDDPGAEDLADRAARRDAVRIMLEAIRDTGADLVQARLEGRTLADLAQERGEPPHKTRAAYNRQITQLRRWPPVTRLWREYQLDKATPYYLQVGKERAQFTSSVEQLAMIRERLAAEIDRYFPERIKKEDMT